MFISNISELKTLDLDTQGILYCTFQYIPLLSSSDLPDENDSDYDDEEDDFTHNFSPELLTSDIIHISNTKRSTTNRDSLLDSFEFVDIAEHELRGVFSISSIRCRDLKGLSAFGSDDPSHLKAYITFQISKSTSGQPILFSEKTSLVESKADPSFFDNFNFILENPQNMFLFVKVWDQMTYKADRLLGQAKIKLEDLIPFTDDKKSSIYFNLISYHFNLI